jgi:adenylate cyclase
MGDTVNLASRLEWVNKEYGTLLCVSHTVYKNSHKEYDFRELDTIRAKWKHQGIQIYELLGLPGSKNQTHHTYEEWLALYYEGHYHKAMKLLEPISDIDNPAQTIIDRCKELIREDIKLENGIWTMNTK